jgi:type II secretion system protein G
MNTLKKRILLGTGVLVIAGVAAYWYWSPYLTMRDLQRAAASADADSFNDHVDYPALRDSLKGQLSARMTRELHDQAGAGDEFAQAGSALGSMLGLAMVDKMVDAVVRPETVMQAMKSGKFQLRGRAPRTEESKEVAASLDIQTLTQALKLYKLDHGSYPTQEEGLQILVTPAPGDASGRNYLEKLPSDPWGRAYQYTSPGKDSAAFDLTHLPPPATTDKPEAVASSWHTERKGVDKILVHLGEEDGVSKAGPTLVMRREGFANWKLTEIRLPE